MARRRLIISQRWVRVDTPTTIYYLRDQYTTAVAAGSVNATVAEPGGTGTAAQRTRTVTDTANTLSIADGKLVVVRTGSNDPRLSYGQFTRVPGLIYYSKSQDTGGRHSEGWYYTDLSFGSDIFAALTTNVLSVTDINGASSLAVGTYSDNLWYERAIALRAAGAFFFVKGGTQYPYWTLLWVGKGSNYNPKPTLNVGLGNYNTDEVAIPTTLWLPTPLVSDGMSAAATDGAGHAETTGLGSGGSGKAYTDIGTWGVSSGAKACSALDGGIGISTVDCGKADVLHYVTITRSGDNVGVVVRYASATNYVYAYTDGTNVTLRKVVNGSDSEVLAATAVTYAAAKDLAIICFGTKFRVFYNNLAVGAEQTISDATLQSGTGVGLYTTNTGNTFDNLITYARGTAGEHESNLTW